MRTATYPLFLHAIPGPALLPLQLFLFAAALSWLALYSSRFLHWAVATILVLAIAANPFLWQLQATILTEALTTPLLVLVVGCTVGFAATERRSLIIASAALCGIATSARPSLLPLILTPLCLLWLTPRSNDRIKLSALMLIAFAAPVAAERIYSSALHGPALTSPMGKQLFMKAAMIDAPPTIRASRNAFDRELTRELDDGYEPVRRLLDRAPNRNVRSILATNYQACAIYSCFDDEWAKYPMGEAELYRHLFRVAVARLESNPLAYLRFTVGEYPRLWLLHPRKIPSIARNYNAFLEREAPIPFQDRLGDEGRPTPQAQQRSIFVLDRALFAGIGILAAVMAVGLAFWNGGSMSVAALSLLAGSQAVLVFSAFLGSAQLRYAMGMWPTVIAGEVLAVAAVLMAWRPQLLSRSADKEPHGFVRARA